jgi:hypothetical protein
MTTANKGMSVQNVLDLGDPDFMSDALARIKAGKKFSTVKVTVTALGATASPDITSAAVLAAAVVSGIDLAEGETLPPIGLVRSLRVTASGTAASLGTYGITDVGGTPIIPPGGASAAMGIARLSDDGTTLTFPNTVTAFVLIYEPKADTQQTFERL